MLQMAIVHTIVFLILNIVNIENPDLVESFELYFTPFIVIPILLAVWGFQIIIRMLVPYYANLNLLKKFLAFQLVLVVCKLQPVLFNLVFKHVEFECEGPITPFIKMRSELLKFFYIFELIGLLEKDRF